MSRRRPLGGRANRPVVAAVEGSHRRDTVVLRLVRERPGLRPVKIRVSLRIGPDRHPT